MRGNRGEGKPFGKKKEVVDFDLGSSKGGRKKGGRTLAEHRRGERNGGNNSYAKRRRGKTDRAKEDSGREKKRRLVSKKRNRDPSSNGSWEGNREVW